jgi:beta-glucanase (GH16 family)
MCLKRARSVALHLAAVLAVTLAVTNVPESAEAATAPTVSLHQLSTTLMGVSGRTARVAPRVRIDRYTRSGWVVVRRTRAHAHRYATSVSMAAGTAATFRVVSYRRSRKFVIQMPASRTAAKTSYDACGARPLKADGTAWSCTFDDEFAGTSLNRAKWVPQTSFVSGSADAYSCYLDDPSTVNVANGTLNLTVHKVATAVSCGMPTPTNYVSGMVSTYHLFSQQYGRFEARIRNTATTGPGLHEAFWLWPDDRYASALSWPDAGEIDVSETYSYYSMLSIPFLHYSADAGGSQPGVNTAWDCTATRGQWTTYTLEWSATRLSILVNGKLCLSNTSADSAFAKPYIAALTQGLGEGANALTSSTPIPATMNVDYVRVWR